MIVSFDMLDLPRRPCLLQPQEFLQLCLGVRAVLLWRRQQNRGNRHGRVSARWIGGSGLQTDQ
jgi:hypothetical protein